MPDAWQLLTSIDWWISVVLVGLAINLVTPTIGRMIERFTEFLDDSGRPSRARFRQDARALQLSATRHEMVKLEIQRLQHTQLWMLALAIIAAMLASAAASVDPTQLQQPIDPELPMTVGTLEGIALVCVLVALSVLLLYQSKEKRLYHTLQHSLELIEWAAESVKKT